MNDILQFINSNPSLGTITSIVLALIVLNKVQANYIITGKRKEAVRSMNGKIYRFVDQTIVDMEETAVLRIKDIAREKWVKMAKCAHGETEKTCEYLGAYYPNEVAKATGILHDSLCKTTKSSIIQHIDINHFTEKTGEDLEKYYRDTGKELYDNNTRVTKIMGIDDIPLVAYSHDTRFTLDEFVSYYKRIGNEVIRLKTELVKEMKSIEKSLAFFSKLTTLFGRLLKSGD